MQPAAGARAISTDSHQGLTNVGADIALACDAIRAGGVVAYPTEGVFGLGCDPTRTASIEALLSLKHREADRGFILIAASFEQLTPFIAQICTDTQQKLDESWPGPVTWILPASHRTPNLLTGGKKSIAARVTDHPVARQLCIDCNSAIISTSANVSGEPACTDAESVARVFGSSLDYILDQPIGNLVGPTPIFDGQTGKQLR